mmetsp:Transcript_15917/g.49082  ORF Transcript_15917/g.49082 Transcript_15917/m.49082 type:complete len:206 (-) Transcript_15917:90-707(-)
MPLAQARRQLSCCADALPAVGAMSRSRVSKPLQEFAGWPKGIYPMSDGWVPPAYPGEEDLVAFEEKYSAMKKATLVKRHVCVKDPQLVQLTAADAMEKGEFSAICMAIAPGPYSGEGEDKSWYLIVYYEPSKKAKVERAFKVAGAEIGEYEQVPVDPDSKMDEEQTLMHLHGVGSGACIVNSHEYQVYEGDDPFGPTHPDGPLWE